MSAGALPGGAGNVDAAVSDDWFAAMRRGDWEAAWRATDRIELPRRVAQDQPGFRLEDHHLRWNGTPLAGRRVLVRCLHGLGDTLQFARFVPLVAQHASSLQFLVQPHLLTLLHGGPGLGDVANAWTDAAPAPHDVELEVMELAYALRITLDELPAPYPLADLPACRAPFALPQGVGCRVGLVWSASEWDPTRSVPPEALRPLAEVPGVRLFGLQQGPTREAPSLQRAGLVALSERTEAIEDAARAMRELDLVISVDGMTAHLAGSLGVPTWVLLKHEADWRWMDDREDSPWYPGMRLFRQRGAGDWNDVVARVAAALRQFASATGPRTFTARTWAQSSPSTMTLTEHGSTANVSS